MGIQLGTSTISKVYLGNTEIQKVYQGSNLVYSSAFNPLSLSPALWLDSADLSTITKDGSNKVSNWNDKSVNDNNFFNNELDLRYKPVHFSDGIYFEGYNYMQTANITNLGIYEKYTMYWVLKDVAHETGQYNVYGTKRYNYLNNDEFIWYTAYQINFRPVFRHQSDTVNNENQIDIAYKNVLNTTSIWKFQYNQSTWKAFKYNSQVFTENYSNDIIQFDTPMILGKVYSDGIIRKNATNMQGKFKLQEILFFPYELSTDDDTTLYNYLTNKWN